MAQSSLVAKCVAMDNVVIEASRRTPVQIGHSVLVGTRSYIAGCAAKDEAFLAAGSAVCNLVIISRHAEVRINGIVHPRTRLSTDATVPIGWTVVGDPAGILSPRPARTHMGRPAATRLSAPPDRIGMMNDEFH